MAASTAGATPHTDYMVAHLSAMTCADFQYATSQGLTTAVEINLVLGLHPTPQCFPGQTNLPDYVQTNHNYYVMLALSATGSLTCNDIQWNASFGYIHYDELADLLSRVPGCQVTEYQFLVTRAYGDRPFVNNINQVIERGVLGCSDINYRAVRNLITPEQAGWLRSVLTSRGVICGAPAAPPPGAQPAPAGAFVVDYQLFPGGGCWAEPGKYGYALDGTLLHCELRVISAPNNYSAWQWGTPTST